MPSPEATRPAADLPADGPCAIDRSGQELIGREATPEPWRLQARNADAFLDRGVKAGVTRTLAAVMNGMLHARRAGICGGCGQTLPEFDYLPLETFQTPPVSREEKARRADRERRVDLILRGATPEEIARLTARRA